MTNGTAGQLTAAEIIALLKLQPHPEEGGYFAEVYRSAQNLPESLAGRDFAGDRSLATAIYYLLTPDTFSAVHRLMSDEIFHFYLGDPVTMLNLHPDGLSEIVTLGPDLPNGHRVQQVVKKGVWQGSCLVEGGRFALLGTTVAPGFDYRDYEPGDREPLMKRYPEHADLIKRLTR